MDANLQSVMQEKRDLDQYLAGLKSQLAAPAGKDEQAQKMHDALEKAEEAGQAFSEALLEVIESFPPSAVAA